MTPRSEHIRESRLKTVISSTREFLTGGFISGKIGCRSVWPCPQTRKMIGIYRHGRVPTRVPSDCCDYNVHHRARHSHLHQQSDRNTGSHAFEQGTSHVDSPKRQRRDLEPEQTSCPKTLIKPHQNLTITLCEPSDVLHLYSLLSA